MKATCWRPTPLDPAWPPNDPTGPLFQWLGPVAAIQDDPVKLPQGVASAHTHKEHLERPAVWLQGPQFRNGTLSARLSGTGLWRIQPQERLLSPASKAHLSVFSGMGFCLHEEASFRQYELGMSKTGWKQPRLLPPAAHTIYAALRSPPLTRKTEGLASHGGEGARDGMGPHLQLRRANLRRKSAPRVPVVVQ